MNELYAVDGRYFYAGIIVNDDTIVMAAPILKWCIGHDFHNFRLYCGRKRWAVVDCAIHREQPTVEIKPLKRKTRRNLE
jgi:hypothetical protein